MVSPAWPSAQRDVLAFLGERMGDASRRFVDLLGDEIADLRDILRSDRDGRC